MPFANDGTVEPAGTLAALIGHHLTREPSERPGQARLGIVGGIPLRHRRANWTDGHRHLLLRPRPWIAPSPGIASKMMVVASHPWSAWSGTAVLSNWLTAFARDFWWLAPLLLLGAVSIVREVRTPGAHEERDCRVMQQALLGSALVVPAVTLMLLPIHIFPRSLVPLLPLWCAALAILLSEAGLLIGEGRPNLRNVGLAIIVAVGIGSAQLRESANAGYAARHTDSDMAQDIYDQYYHHGFRPDLAAQWLVGQLRHGPTLIVTDFDGYFSLNVIVGRLLNTAPMVVAYYRDQKLKTPSELIRQGVRVFLVAHTLEAANRMTAWFHQPPLSHRDRVAETGFFSIYRLPLAASPPP